MKWHELHQIYLILLRDIVKLLSLYRLKLELLPYSQHNYSVLNKYFKMKDKDAVKIFESYQTGVAPEVGELISNWKSETENWAELNDDMKVQEFKTWVKHHLANRPGGNTVQTDLPSDDELKEMF